MTKVFVENNEESYFNGFIAGELNYNKCVVGIFYFVIVHFCNLDSQGSPFQISFLLFCWPMG